MNEEQLGNFKLMLDLAMETSAVDTYDIVLSLLKNSPTIEAAYGAISIARALASATKAEAEAAIDKLKQEPNE